MGNLVHFNHMPRRRNTAKRTKKNQPQGEIIIFPGVRYERVEEDCEAIDLAYRLQTPKPIFGKKLSPNKLN